MFGHNPCTGNDDQGLIGFTVNVEEEVEDGILHANVSIRGTVVGDFGYDADFTQQEEVSIDANGNGTVQGESEFDILNPETGERFEVHHWYRLTIRGGEVVDVVESEDISNCQLA